MKKFMCKALLDREHVSDTGPDWMTSIRCRLEVAEDHFRIKNRRWQFSDIEAGVLKKIPSAFFWPGYIFSIKMRNGDSHHFGLVYSKYWDRNFPFPVERTTVKILHIWLRRILVLGSLLYLIYDIFFSK